MLDTAITPAESVPAAATRTSPLTGIATMLARGRPADRLYLAVIALEEMAAAYEAEARAAVTTETMDDDARRALAHWRASTHGYARDLRLLADSLDERSRVEIYIEPYGSLRLRLDGRQVIISHPRMLEPDPLAARIAMRFCEMAGCADALRRADRDGAAPALAGDAGSATAPAAGLAPAVPRVDATWSFSERLGPVLQTSAGLHFSFRDTEDLKRRKQVCLTLVHEIEELERALTMYRDRGLLIEWSQLRISPDSASGNQRVIVNHYGHSLVLHLPTLQRATRALDTVRPWLAARVEHRPVQMPPIEADRILAGLVND
ncbi:MAG: hypothetical protein IT495_02205 [Gammaproteobacteria bacterium]|nr:hypothetical protein [Gammaproteobacteria bacterium]